VEGQVAAASGRCAKEGLMMLSPIHFARLLDRLSFEMSYSRWLEYMLITVIIIAFAGWSR
jgi:hypothetical protein